MSLVPQYQVGGNAVTPEQIVDIIPEQEAEDQRIQQSEQNYLNELEANSQKRIANEEKMWGQLGDLSTTIQDLVQKKRDKYVEDRKAQIAFDVLTKGVSPDLEAHFEGTRELLFDTDLKTQSFAQKYEAETGDSVTANEFRNMSGWEKYYLAEEYARQKAKGYNEYVYKAYENTSVTVIRDGKEVTITNDDVMSPSEQAALDEKIKFNYARQFTGLNETLVAKIVKPEIDKYDDLRRKKQAAARENAYQIQRNEADKRFVEHGFVTANPADGYDNAHKFAARYAAQNGTSLAVGRIAFKENLINLVSENKITYPEAMSILYHEEQARDGSMKSLTSWKEWSDLPQELAEAAQKGTKAKLAQKQADIAADLQVIKSQEDLTNQQKSQMMEVYRQKYGGYVPSEIQGALAGHLDDDVARDMLKQANRYQGGVYDFQLADVSTEVYNEYKDKVIGTSAMTPGSSQNKKASALIKAYTNQGTGDTFGETDAKSVEWLTLNDNLTEVFNEAYEAAYLRNGQVVNSPEEAYKAGMRAVEEVIGNAGKVRELMSSDYEEGSDAYEKSIRVGMGQAGGGKWKKNRITSSPTIDQELLEWSKSPLTLTKDLPQYIKDVARRLGISPFDLAQSQLKHIEEDYKPKESKEQDPNISHLIYYQPTPSRITRARIYSDSNGEETSIYNNKALIRDDI
tara:strand:+ start:5973 stop:8024 length:2052 start_codon:yes stop_codon:yes gene_type:complete